MSNPFLFGGLATMGKSFLKSYQGETERLDRKAKDEREQAYVDEVRARDREEYQRKQELRKAFNEGGAAGELETFDAPIANDSPDGANGPPVPQGTTAPKLRIKGTDQAFDDQEQASAELQRYNSPAQRMMRGANKVSSIDLSAGTGLMQQAQGVAKAESQAAQDQAAQIRSTYNNMLLDKIPAGASWHTGAVEAVNSMVGKPIASSEVSPDGATVSMYATGPDGKKVLTGTYPANESGRLKFLDAAMKRDEKEMLTMLAANRRYEETLAAQRGKDEASLQRAIELQAIRDAGRTSGSGGSSSRSSGSSRSGGSGGASDGVTPDAIAKVNEASNILVEASKNADGPMKFGPAQLVDAQSSAADLVQSNPGITAQQAASVAIKITSDPTTIKPRLDLETGRIHGAYVDPNSDARFKVYDFPAIRLEKPTEEDRKLLTGDVAQLRAEERQKDPQLADLIEASAFGGGKPTPALVNRLTGDALASIKQMYTTAGKPVPADAELQAKAAEYVKTRMLPALEPKINVIQAFGVPPKNERKGASGGSSVRSILGGLGLSQPAYVPPADSPAGRAAARRQATESSQAQQDAQRAEANKAKAEQASQEAARVLESKDPAAAQQLQDSPLFSALPTDVKLRVRNLVFGR